MKLIAAVDLNWGIGKDNRLPWHIPEDLKFFKMITSGQNIVMGWSTFESLPKVLPNRRHIVLSRGSKTPQDGVEYVKSVEELLTKYDANQLIVIGGASVYEQLFHLVDYLYITYIYDSHDCDAHFPSYLFKNHEWEEVKSLPLCGACIVEYKRLT